MRNPHGRQAVARRAGHVNSAAVIVIGSVVVAGVLTLGLAVLGWVNRPSAGREVTLFCAAGLRGPVEEIAREYGSAYGVSVRVQYGGSNTLLGQIEAGKVGDLFLAGDQTYVELARQKGLAAEILPVAVMRPVIAVRKGNPDSIHGVDDLLREDLRVALGSPDQTAIGRLVRQELKRSGHWERLHAHVTSGGVYKPTVTDLANDVELGSADAAIVWDAIARQHPKLEAVAVPELKDARSHIALCVLTSTADPTAALRLARYLAASDRGLPVFESMGYEPVEGDVWEEVPEITFFVGSVNRRALEQTVNEFQDREGAVVNTIYNGCGILTAQMRTIREGQSGGFPDAYMACDVYYLENVKEWFQEAVNVSQTEIVMVVEEGNPKGIEALADLARPGVRVVVGQPEQCTIGALTRQMLQSEGIHDQVMENVVSQTATSAMLVPAITTKSADVALAYATDCKAEAARVDAVRIDSEHNKAVQPFAIARSSEHKNLSRRLFRAIALSAARFAEAGFDFRLDPEGESCAVVFPLPEAKPGDAP